MRLNTSEGIALFQDIYVSERMSRLRSKSEQQQWNTSQKKRRHNNNNNNPKKEESYFARSITNLLQQSSTEYSRSRHYFNRVLASSISTFNYEELLEKPIVMSPGILEVK
ncbi:hypothetical protein AVEN_258437-1 [Araneus ventricosus]|uniref:Uncharacterized protein n=1 Tax=Araneus ventricosus TaxID=182803 RepID=A0A4Y2DJ61_ARAVE|nr:hypothetical protein AVEN_258437-1 [Araneus ventricosus]